MHIIRLLAAALATALVAAPALAEMPAPELVATFPPDQGEIEAPLGEITLIFKAEADLVSVAVITPDQRRLVLHDAMEGGEERKGDVFVLSLPEAVSLPGTYLIDISASVTDLTDSTASSTSTYTSFTIADAPAGEEASPSDTE